MPFHSKFEGLGLAPLREAEPGWRGSGPCCCDLRRRVSKVTVSTKLTPWICAMYSYAIGEVRYGRPAMRFPGRVNTVFELTCAGQGDEALPVSPPPVFGVCRLTAASLLSLGFRFTGWWLGV